MYSKVINLFKMQSTHTQLRLSLKLISTNTSTCDTKQLFRPEIKHLGPLLQLAVKLRFS